MELDNAPLPAPKRRGRPPKVVTLSTPSGSEDGWVRKAFESVKVDGADEHALDAAAYLTTGWITGAVVNRYPTEGLTMLVGGRLNGREHDMRPYKGAKFVALPLGNGCVEWYERGEISGYYWVASITPQGMELRLTL